MTEVSVMTVGVRLSAPRSAAVRNRLRDAFARRPSGLATKVLCRGALAAGITTAIVAATNYESVRHRIGAMSLIDGWLPPVTQALTVIAFVCAVGWRSRRWRVLLVPLALVVGVTLAAWAHWYITATGITGDGPPRTLWIWIGLTGAGAAIAVLGWRSARWWRRIASLLAIPLCLLSCALTVNQWVSYFPTVYGAWSQLTAGPLPDQADRATVVAMQRNGAVPSRGVVVSVAIPADASKFKHRDELVYLPPAWFATTPAPRLPVIMMIGGEFNTPADWLRVGQAARTMDDFAAAHGGNSPVLVFADSGGAFNVDTECVNGSRGNAADHLTKDIVPYMVSDFGVSVDRANWGVAGFSAGGTCAVDLTVMHPELFSVFLDIAGDLSPNTGTKAQTIARLFGGDPNAWAAFDPGTVMVNHGPYSGVSGWFATVASGDAAAGDAARTLCALGSRQGIRCAVVPGAGKHDWIFAASSFATALPWMAGHLLTHGVPSSVRPAQ
jgi:S-formylglutathione hydrolase FrmB